MNARDLSTVARGTRVSIVSERYDSTTRTNHRRVESVDTVLRATPATLWLEGHPSIEWRREGGKQRGGHNSAWLEVARHGDEKRAEVEALRRAADDKRAGSKLAARDAHERDMRIERMCKDLADEQRRRNEQMATAAAKAEEAARFDAEADALEATIDMAAPAAAEEATS